MALRGNIGGWREGNENMEIQIKKRIYDCTDNNLVVSKTGMFGKKIVWECRISSIEILRYNPSFPELILATPKCSSNYAIQPGKSWAENLSKLYDYLVAHGATQRNLGHFKAAFATHSTNEAIKQAAKIHNKKIANSQPPASNSVNRAPISHFGCKMKKEEKYTCQRCNAVWYSGTYDVVKNFANATHGSLWSLNQVKDFSQCPQCGSRASQHRTVKVWYDKKGNAVDYEE